jgi:multiple sugar transport system substrate-binding protein
MGQAGADPFHLKTSAARNTLKFIYDMLHTYKIMPPNTVSADYTSLQNEFIDGRLAMWPVWAGFYSQFVASPSFMKKYKVAVSLPPKGPVNNSTLADSWGYSVSKYSKNKDMAYKFIDYVTSQAPEVAIAKAEGTLPANLNALNTSAVQSAISFAKFVALYNQKHLTRPRPIMAQVQRLSDAYESAINQYLNNQLSLDAAIQQAQSKIDQIQQNS